MLNAKIIAANRYAAKGFQVLPLVGKAPAVERGLYSATTDVAQIEEWWGANPDWNIGIRTGEASGVCVVDIDRKPGGPNGFRSLWDLNRDFGWIRGVPFQHSSFGGHFFFRCYDTEMRDSVGKIGPGIDVRANGGYIVVAPSRHPVTDIPYSWRNGRSIINSDFGFAPEWLLEAASRTMERPSPKAKASHIYATGAYGLKALAGECEKIENARNGAQHQTLNDAAFRIGKLIRRGLIDKFDAEYELERSASKMVNYDRYNRWSNSQIRQIISKGLSDGELS